MSVGNEQPNSVSGYHTVNSNVFRDNLSAGLYYGSTNTTSWVQNCTVKNNTIKNNYVLDSVLRAKANNQYGITDSSQRYTEVNFYRLRNSMFKQNTIESLSNIVLGLYLTQTTDTLWYNTYYVISGDACQATFVQDKNNDGVIALPADSIYFSFHQYAKKTGYDQNSSCEGQSYNPNGCGTTALMALRLPAPEIIADENKVEIISFPNPVVNDLFVKLSLQNSGAVRMQMFDLSGRAVLQQQEQLSQGTHQLTVRGIKQKGLASGVYLLKLTTPDVIKTIRVVVQ